MSESVTVSLKVCGCLQTIKNPEYKVTECLGTVAVCGSMGPWCWEMGSCIGLTGTEGAGRAHLTPSAGSRDTSSTRTPSPGTEHLPEDGQGPRPETSSVRGSRVKHSPRITGMSQENSIQWAQTHGSEESCSVLWPGHDLGRGERAWTHRSGKDKILVKYAKCNQAFKGSLSD